MKTSEYPLATIQTPIIDRPWQVTDGDGDGFVVAHCKGKAEAEFTARQYPGTKVRWAG